MRFAGLLPITKLNCRLPVADFTPMIHATRLGRDIGMTSLYLKNETALPTKTTKDRMAPIALAYLHERGVRVCTVSSTGNSGVSRTLYKPFPACTFSCLRQRTLSRESSMQLTPKLQISE